MERATLLSIGIKAGNAGSGARTADCPCNGWGMTPLPGSRTRLGTRSTPASGGGRGVGSLRRASPATQLGRATAPGAAPMGGTMRIHTQPVLGVAPVDKKKPWKSGAPQVLATATAITTVTTTVTIAVTTASTIATAPTTASVTLAKPLTAATIAGD